MASVQIMNLETRLKSAMTHKDIHGQKTNKSAGSQAPARETFLRNSRFLAHARIFILRCAGLSCMVICPKNIF
jgi:hypothetical protein